MHFISLCCLNILAGTFSAMLNKSDKRGYLSGSASKESSCNAGDLGSIPGLGRSPEEGKGYPIQYSGLENSMDWLIHGVTKSRTRLRDFHFNFPCLDNDLGEKSFNFSPLCRVLAVSLSYMAFIGLSCISSIHNRLRIFIMKWYMVADSFPASIEVIT